MEGATMRKFIIERELPAIGSAERQALREAAQKSNATLKELGPDIQWVESYVANDKTFCVYLAKDEAIIHEHAKRSGFPANKITEVRRMIDPTTATDSH
jgi:cell division inhibitor SulA